MIPVGGLLGVVRRRDVPGRRDRRLRRRVPGVVRPRRGATRTPGPSRDGPRRRPARCASSRQGEGGEPVLLLHGFGGDLNNWLFNLAGAGRAAAPSTRSSCRGTAARPRTSGHGDLASLVDAVPSFLDAVGRSSARTSSATRSAGSWRRSWRCATPAASPRSTLVAPARASAPEINGDYIDGFIAAEPRRELKPVLRAALRRPGPGHAPVVDDVLKYKRIDGVDAAAALDRRARLRRRAPARRSSPIALGELDVPAARACGASRTRSSPPSTRATSPAQAEVHVLEGSGHSPHMEAAGDVNRVMERFLAGV